MNWLDILEKYGIAVLMSIGMAFYIWKSTKFIQDELQKELRESFNRLESIIIKLIDNSKKQEIKQEGLIKSYKSLVDIAELDVMLKLPDVTLKVIPSGIFLAIPITSAYPL